MWFFYLKIGPTHLDYDNDIFAGMHFKYTLLVRVSDEGSPVLSSKNLLIWNIKMFWVI